MTLKKAILRLLLGMGFGFAFLQSIVTTVNWWQGTQPMTLWDWLWVGVFPVLLWIYFRHFSVLGCKNPACLLPEDKRRGL